MVIAGRETKVYRIKAPDELKAFYGSMAFDKYEFDLVRLHDEWQNHLKHGRDQFLVEIEDTGNSSRLYVYDGVKKKRVCTIAVELVHPIMQRIWKWRAQNL